MIDWLIYLFIKIDWFIDWVCVLFRSDWLLKFMYRAASVQFTIAGLSAVKWKHRIMHNVDLTHVVSSA